MDGQRGTGTTRVPAIAHFGAASRDVVDDDSRGWRLGGGVTYSALTTARLGLPTAALIGVDPEAADASELDLLRSAGVDLRLVRLERGPVFRNTETPVGRAQTCLEPGAPLPVVDLPREWHEAASWVLAPVAGEIGEPWAAILPDGAYVVVGWQGLLRALTAGARVERTTPSRSALIARADLVGVSRHDLGAVRSFDEIAGLLHPGAQLLVTEGISGGWLVTTSADGIESETAYPSIPSDRQVDPTGAGDTFLAALVASRLLAVNGRSVRESAGAPFSRADRRSLTYEDLGFAAAAASLVVEGPGLHGVPKRKAVVARLEWSTPRAG